MIDKFNLRVYGTWIEDCKVFLLREVFRGVNMVKFPGGGVGFGEGIADALKREFREELHSEIEILSHLYTTDFFQASAFHTNEQLISVYYRVKLLQEPTLQIRPDVDGPKSFFWVDIRSLDPHLLSFPVDRRVCSMLREQV